MVKLNHWIPATRTKERRTIDIPSSMPEWKDVEIKDLAIKFQPTAITTMQGKRIDINKIYAYNTENSISNVYSGHYRPLYFVPG